MTLRKRLRGALRRLVCAVAWAPVIACAVPAEAPAADAHHLQRLNCDQVRLIHGAIRTGDTEQGKKEAGRLAENVASRSRQETAEMVENGTASPDGGIVLWEPCTRKQAERWAADAERDGTAALRSASCYVTLIERGKAKSAGLEDARRGRAAAEAAVRRFPASGLAHYLAAYLAGLHAERDRLRGLALVRIIEREARIAADLDPGLDRGGPDRMLGELYLRAPSYPFSVGDLEKAVRHYQRAVAIEPAAPENRIGLAEALLEDNKPGEACGELRALLAEMPAPPREGPVGKEAREMMERACSRDGER